MGQFFAGLFPPLKWDKFGRKRRRKEGRDISKLMNKMLICRRSKVGPEPQPKQQYCQLTHIFGEEEETMRLWANFGESLEGAEEEQMKLPPTIK
jgi:hypothetical protein